MGIASNHGWKLWIILALLAGGTLAVLAGWRLIDQHRARLLVDQCLAEAQDSQRRKGFCRQAIQTDPSFGQAYLALGELLEQEAAFEEAVQAYRQAVEHLPGRASPSLRLAECLVKSRGLNEPEVRLWLRRFLSAAPQDPETADNTQSLREAREWLIDLEKITIDENGFMDWKDYTSQEIVAILLRSQVRGASRYDGPRVPLRLSFLPREAVIGASGRFQLQEVSKALSDGRLSKARIRIEGHSDDVEAASRSGREALSLERAQAVLRHLVESGHNADRIETVGYAEDYPVRPNLTEADRARNRRVELINLTDRTRLVKDVRD